MGKGGARGLAGRGEERRGEAFIETERPAGDGGGERGGRRQGSRSVPLERGEGSACVPMRGCTGWWCSRAVRAVASAVCAGGPRAGGSSGGAALTGSGVAAGAGGGAWEGRAASGLFASRAGGGPVGLAPLGAALGVRGFAVGGVSRRPRTLESVERKRVRRRLL